MQAIWEKTFLQLSLALLDLSWFVFMGYVRIIDLMGLMDFRRALVVASGLLLAAAAAPALTVGKKREAQIV